MLRNVLRPRLGRARPAVSTRIHLGIIRFCMKNQPFDIYTVGFAKPFVVHAAETETANGLVTFFDKSGDAIASFPICNIVAIMYRRKVAALSPSQGAPRRRSEQEEPTEAPYRPIRR